MESPNTDDKNIINNNNLRTTTATIDHIDDDIENDNNNNTTDTTLDSVNDNVSNNITNSINIKSEHYEDDEQADEDDQLEDDEDRQNMNKNQQQQDQHEQQYQKLNDCQQDETEPQQQTTNDSNDDDYNDELTENDSAHQQQTRIQQIQNQQQTQELMKGGVIRVQESQDEDSESIELELEDDHTLLLTSLTSLFPDATGLKYRHPETNTLRGVKLVDGRFAEPLDGWSSVQSYICVTNRGTKRKNDTLDDDDQTNSRAKIGKTDASKAVISGNGSDLVVLGLPWTTTEDSMRNYFEQYGEVSMVQVKTDPKSGKSRGFGFVRFAKSSIQNKLLSMRHFIDGRWCDVRIPLSKAEAEATRQAHLSRKIFVGRLPDDITTDDLRNHFSEYGTLTDVFIPKPFRNFAFVTFGTSDMAQSLFKHKHVIKGSQIQISEAIPRDNNGGPQQQHNNHQHINNNNSYGNNFNTGAQQANNNYGSTGGYGGNNNNNIYPFNNYNTHQASHHFHNKNNFNGGNFGASGMYQNARKMHPQSTYYQMPSYGSSGPSSSVDSSNYLNHSGHSDYSTFGGGGGTTSVTPTGYSQQATNLNGGGQYYKIQQQQQQQQPIIAPNQTHSTYPNQPSYSSNHGANFSRTSYGSVWK